MFYESKHVRKFMEKHANNGEEVIAWSDGYIGDVMGKGKKAQHNGALIVSADRVIFYRSGLFGEVLETMPLKNITSIERKSLLGHHTIRLHTSHDELEFKTFNKDSQASLVSAIETGRYTDQGATTQSIPKEDSFDKLKKLAELKDAGVLSEYEFKTKKAKLLAEI